MALESANPRIRWVKRIGILALGLTVNEAMVYGYDFVVYPYLIIHYGLGWGWILAVEGSIILCLATLMFYDITKQDWLGIELIKTARDNVATGRIRKFFRNLLDRSDVIAFFFLNMRYDPFIATVYLRRGSENYTMSVRDWKIFAASIVVSNLWWGLLVFGAIEVFRKWIAPAFPSLAHTFGL